MNDTHAYSGNEPTFVRHSYFACFTDDFGNVFCMIDIRLDEHFKLKAVEITVTRREAKLRTTDILTDCASACDNASFVLAALLVTYPQEN